MHNKRDKYMENVLQLTINSGKINESAKYILYSEESKIVKQEKIKETKESLKNIVENVKNIAESLELSIEEIIDAK